MGRRNIDGARAGKTPAAAPYAWPVVEKDIAVAVDAEPETKQATRTGMRARAADGESILQGDPATWIAGCARSQCQPAPKTGCRCAAKWTSSLTSAP